MLVLNNIFEPIKERESGNTLHLGVNKKHSSNKQHERCENGNSNAAHKVMHSERMQPAVYATFRFAKHNQGQKMNLDQEFRSFLTVMFLLLITQHCCCCCHSQLKVQSSAPPSQQSHLSVPLHPPEGEGYEYKWVRVPAAGGSLTDRGPCLMCRTQCS